ncbi:MAG: hypothetical protein ACJ8CB_26600 [Ktedonobacteraceae bacterium]
MCLTEYQGAPQSAFHEPAQQAGGVLGEPSRGSQAGPAVQRCVPPPQSGR